MSMAYNPLGGSVYGLSGPELEDLKKSMLAGEPVGNTGTGGAALQRESVEGTVINATFSEEQLVFYKTLRERGMVEDIQSTLRQLVLRRNVGSLLTPTALGESGNATAGSHDIERLMKILKVVQAKMSWSALSDALGNNIVQPGIGGGKTLKDEEVGAKTLLLLMNIAHLLWHGDSSVNSNEPDGIFKQILGGTDVTVGMQVIDLHGAVASPDYLSAIASTMSEDTFGYPDAIWTSPTAAAGLGRMLQSAGRFPMGTPIQNYNALLQSIAYSGGTMQINQCPFLSPDRVKLPTAAFSSDSPAAPLLTSVAASGTGSYFEATDLGIYKYKVVACGPTGYSVSSAITDAIDVDTAGKSARITLNDSGISGVTHYVVWRSEVGGAGTYRYAFRQAKAGSGATVLIDTNFYMPGTTSHYITRMRPDYVRFTQAAPMAHIPQPAAGLMQNGLLFLCFTPIVVLPHRMIWVRNAGIPAVDSAV